MKAPLSDKDILIAMAEGDPGGLSVLMKLREGGVLLVMAVLLDQMNMRGLQIWVAYKHWAGQDMDKLMKGLLEQDQGMVDVVNAECATYGEVAKVVTTSWSSKEG